MASNDSPRRPSPDGRAPERPVLMGPPPIPRAMPILPDTHFNKDDIPGLNLHNFSHFIFTKEKALIMFYNSNGHNNPCLDKEFLSATVRQYPAYHAFAAVDCSVHDTLCQQERVCATPVLKLYSNGFEVSRIEDTNFITGTHLHMLMKMAPVLTQPRKLLNQMSDQTRSRKKVKMGTVSLRRK